MSSSSKPDEHPLAASEYFRKLSSIYAASTGNATLKVFEEFLRKVPTPITVSSIINDNACGPAIASSAIIAHLGSQPQRIDATDNSPGMVAAAKYKAEDSAWTNVHVSEMDSHALTFPDGTFDVSVSNISVTNYDDPPKALGEIHRTLKKEGFAVVTIWKDFGVATVIHEAQRRLREESVPMVIPKAEFMNEGHLRNVMVNAGFKNATQHEVQFVCTGREILGLREFMLGEFTAKIRTEWTEDEERKWPLLIDEVIAEQVETFGGIKFEAWCVTGTK